MNNYINRKYSYEDSPKTQTRWRNLYEKDRIKIIYEVLNQDKKYESFEIIKAEEKGHVTLRIEKSIQASERGILLLKLEEYLKKTIDQGITIWLEPVGDKSKLRNLRGIEIKTKT